MVVKIVRLIHPFQLREMFRSARSVALIGNAPYVLKRRKGSLIDTYDVVVRFNRARIQGYEEFVGTRTDILFTHTANNITRAPAPERSLKPRCIVCFTSPKKDNKTDINPFAEWVGDCPTLVSFGPDLYNLPIPKRYGPLMLGNYALYTMTHLLDIQQLFVTGFTFFGATGADSGHYWEESLPVPTVVHDVELEAKLFLSMLSHFKGQLAATPEIRGMARKYGFKLPIGIASYHEYSQRRSIVRRVAGKLAWELQRAEVFLRRISEI